MTDANKPFGMEITIYSMGGTAIKREYREFSNSSDMSDWYEKNKKPAKSKPKKDAKQ